MPGLVLLVSFVLADLGTFDGHLRTVLHDLAGQAELAVDIFAG